jgi:hypothetical protein
MGTHPAGYHTMTHSFRALAALGVIAIHDEARRRRPSPEAGSQPRRSPAPHHPYRFRGRRSSIHVVQDAAVGEGHDRIAQVYRDQSQTMWRSLYSFSGDREVASDALAEAFARAPTG